MAKVKLSEFKAAFVLMYGENDINACWCGYHDEFGNVLVEVPIGDKRVFSLFGAFNLEGEFYIGQVVGETRTGVDRTHWDQYELDCKQFDLEN